MKKSFKIIGIIAAVVLIAIAVIIYLVPKPETPSGVVEKNLGEGEVGVTSNMLDNQTKEAAEETTKLINDVIGDTGTSSVKTITINTSEGDGTGSTTATEIKAVTVVSGASAIDINSGQVINESGEVVDNAAEAASQSAPSQSYPISEAEAPASSIKLKVTSTSFTPNSFTVNRGQAISLVVTNTNESTFSEVFRFDDPSLSGVVIGLAKGETKSIVFNAPNKAGEYVFYSSMFDHRAQGAVGKMIVK